MLIAGVFHEDFANAFDKPGSIVNVSEIHEIKFKTSRDRKNIIQSSLLAYNDDSCNEITAITNTFKPSFWVLNLLQVTGHGYNKQISMVP